MTPVSSNIPIPDGNPSLPPQSISAPMTDSGATCDPPMPAASAPTASSSLNLLSRFSKRRAFSPWDTTDLVQAVSSAQRALTLGNARASRPQRQGVCGTYLISSQDTSLAVFKPRHQEASYSSPSSSSSLTVSTLPASSPPTTGECAPTPTGRSASSHRAHGSERGFHAGDGCYKEVAAYLLDHNHMAGVPATALAECDIDQMADHTLPHPEQPEEKSLETAMGAFQVFQPNDGDAEDFGPGLFPKEAVQKIAAFDLRILNADRHAGNILVVRHEGSVNLVPIDHGFCLPDTITAMNWPCWMDWPQSKLPLSETHASHIDMLDHEMDARILDDELEGQIRPAALLNLRIASTLLQLGTRAGLSLYEIGTLVYSRTPEQGQSVLERIANEATEAAVARQARFDDSYDSEDQEEQIFSLEDIGPSPTAPWDREASDAFQYKYARNLIQQQVDSMVKSKTRAALGRSVEKSMSMGRVRSIPEFGRPLVPRRRNLVPVASPMTSGGSTTSVSTMIDKRVSTAPRCSR